MYSIVLMAAMTAAPDAPQALLCPVSPSRYTGGFLSHHWLKRCFYDCCLPARYGWVNCHNKGFGFYPGAGCCTPCSRPLWHGVGSCEIYGGCGIGGGWRGHCGGFFNRCGGGGCFKGWGIGGHWAAGHNWGGLDWGIGKRPYYWPSPGCYPDGYAPYAHSAPAACGCYGGNTFDSALIGHSHGVGYAGFAGAGNFGMYGYAPMQHPPTLADVPSYVPQPMMETPVGIPGRMPNYQVPTTVPGNPGTLGAPATGIPESLIPPPPMNLTPPIPTPAPAKDAPKKDVPKVALPKAESAVVQLTVPQGAKVFVNGHPLKNDAAERMFRTPAIPYGESYAYTVKAVISINGQEVVEQKTVTVSAGSTSKETFSDLIAQVEKANIKLASGNK